MEPLRGVRILDLSWYAPGPFCSLVCASLGAEVVKVEPPSGDPLRGLDSGAFARLNAGKKSLRLDLKRERGRAALFALVRSADALIEGFRPGVAARLGLGYDAVRAVTRDILYLSITGYGQSGPYRERAGHDVNYMALAGGLQGASAPLSLQVADFAAGGLYAVVGLVAGLLDRARTGGGAYLDLSMFHGLLAMSRLAEGAAADRLSGRYANYTVYETRDGGGLSVGALEPKFWERFCRVVDREDLVGRVGEPEARAEVARIVAERDLGDWAERFRDVDACVEPIRTPGEAFLHPQAVHRGAAVAAAPWPFGCEPSRLGSPPALGEHTDALLRDAGLPPEAIATLHDEGVC